MRIWSYSFFLFSSVFVVLTGCESLYFGSYSRVGIDASHPDGAGIGVKIAVLNVTPTKSDGTAYSVLGQSDIDISLTQAVIAEEFAVGLAADCAAMSNPVDSQEEGENVSVFLNKTAADDRSGGLLLFGTSMSLSLVDLSWGGASAQGITLGYKRSTGIRVPVKKGTIGSAYAKLMLNTEEMAINGIPKSTTGGVRLQHIFATGKAATIVASRNAEELQGIDHEVGLGCLDNR